MIDTSLIALGKAISKISQSLNRGNGSTWPGHIALKGNKNFIRDILANSNIKIIIVAGTNGKTTTAGLIREGLEKNGKKVIQNNSGANLINGLASSLLLHTNTSGKLTQDYALFEVDENALPRVLEQITPDYLVLLNLFRDQLDRYGEINTITKKWNEAISKLPEKTKLILNADDSQIAYIGLKNKINTLYFSLDFNKSKEQSHEAADSVSCPKCGNNLTFKTTTFSHLGEWRCTNCGLTQPKPTMNSFSLYPLSGTYNKYNTHAAALTLEDIGMSKKEIADAFSQFIPIFGRQEIIKYHERNVQLFLSKNPTSFNQSYQTIKELSASTLLIVLNDRIPDGRDISWIWDTDLSGIENFKHVILSGDRVYDMSLRIKYELHEQWKAENDRLVIEPDLKKAIDFAVNQTSKNETLFILPTYSAMLDARKILTGKKIL